MRNAEEGLGFSIVVYACVMMVGLAAIVLPVYWANSGTVYDNPQRTASSNPLGPAYARKSHSEYPLAVLNNQPVVDAATLAQVNTAKAPPPEKPKRAASRSARRHYTQAPDRPDRYAQAPENDAQSQRRTPHSFFSLF